MGYREVAVLSRDETAPKCSRTGRHLKTKIVDRSAKAGVVGLGYVGLPLAVEIARTGYHVTGIDLNREKVDAVNAGHSYILDVAGETLLALVAANKMRATQSLAAVESLDTLNICVPTPLRKNKDPDLSYVIAAVESIRNHIRPGQLIILESTTYPGTTREVVLPILEESGLKVGQDFFLAYSPERVDPGNKTYMTRNIPKVIGGVTQHCTSLALTFYQKFVETVVPVSSSDCAEMVKLLENTFRSVNIALANEMALTCHSFGINAWEVIEAAKTKPFGFMPFYPGPGLGGHCIPVDPYYLTWRAKLNGCEPRLIELASHINSQMPRFTVDAVGDALNEKRKAVKGANVLGIGVTYKRDTNDLRESPALQVLEGLAAKGASVHFADPYVQSIPVKGKTIKGIELNPETLQAMDCVAILTDHSVFDYSMIAKHSPLILDTRNVLKGFSRPDLILL
ncbi:MAG: nucleotide sugar dehydrogenase [Alphaproteobacteria bacterium]